MCARLEKGLKLVNRRMGTTTRTTRLAPLMRIVLIASLGLVAILWLVGINQRVRGRVEYFPETGHNLKGEFLKFFREHGGLEIFGYPITEELVEDGQLVQYFQRTRLESHPENPAERRVRLGVLAEWMGKNTPPIDPSLIPLADDPDRRYFSETGHTVTFSFLAFFDAKGGVDIFGYPITEYFSENGRFVQYFQSARMEFYPDRPPAQQVQLADLGEIYFEWAGLDASLRRAAPARLNDEPALGPTTLRLDASVTSPYTSYPGQQTVHVYVTDQRRRGVKDARVTFVVEYPGVAKTYNMAVTGAKGYTSYTFDLERSPVARSVVIRITATFGSLTGETQTSFVFWR